MTNYLAQPLPSLKIDTPAHKPGLSATSSPVTFAASSISIDAIMNKLDALILNEFIFGIYKNEYRDLQNKKKSYVALRQESFLPAAGQNHLVSDPSYRIHASLFKLAGGLFESLNQLRAQQAQLDAATFQQQLFVSLQNFQTELTALQKEDESYHRSITKYSLEEQAERQAQRDHLLSALMKFNPLPTSAPKAKEAKAEVMSATTKATEINSTQLSQPIKQNHLQREPDLAREKRLIATGLQSAKEKINEQWHLLIKKQYASDVIIKNIVTTIVKELDKHLKNHFLLNKFKNDFNVPSRPVLVNGQLNTAEPSTYEEDFKARGIESTFNTYKKRLFTVSTDSYLRSAYPNDFLAYRQMVDLLEEIQTIQTSSLNPKDALHKIFASIEKFSQSTWEIQVDVRKTLVANDANNLYLGPSLQKFSTPEYRKKASTDVISFMNDFLNQLNTALSAQANLLPAQPPVCRTIKATNAQFFVAPKPRPTTVQVAPPVKMELKSSAGEDLLGQVADLGCKTLETVSQWSNWACNMWKGSSSNKAPQKPAPSENEIRPRA